MGTGADEAGWPTGVALASPSLGRIVALAADMLGAPAACLALRRDERAVVVARAGSLVLPREMAWAFPLSRSSPLSVDDLQAEPRASDAVPPWPARFYAGAPVVLPGGEMSGTLCVLDAAPRPALPARDLARLAALAALAGDAIGSARARERAEALAETKAGLLADVSHEMRTPLGGIVGFAEVLKRDGALEGDALRAAERIEEAGRGLLSIVSDALDLTRFESGLVRLEPRPFSPARLVEDAAAMVRADAERKGLRLVVDLRGASPEPLLADPNRLRQVILNLLTNAVKFTERGTVRVELAVGSGQAAVPMTVAVEDSGVGLTPDGMSRLFRRFAQADREVARQHGGNGLGLAISKTLVEAMGGSIAVESAPGAGARFTVSLVLPRAADPPSPAQPRLVRAPERDGLRGLAVLVAEDAAMNQKLVTEMLEPLGAAVDVVGDGAAAVEAAARNDYALVLMDMEMPVLGGLDATRRIRALGGAAGSVPIVALTANVFPEQLDLCRAAGMDDHLTKPFGADDLAAVAMRWARRLASAGEGAD